MMIDRVCERRAGAIWSAVVIFWVCGAASGIPPFTIEAIVEEGDDVPGVGSVTRIDNLAVSSAGGWIVEADTDNADPDADSVLIKNGELFLREGDPIDVPTGGTIGSFDSVNLNLFGDSGWNLFLDDTGSLFTDSGLFFNDELVFQEGAESGAPGFSEATAYLGFFDVKMNDLNGLLLAVSVDDPAIPSGVDRALVLVDYDADSGTYEEGVVAKEGDVLAGQSEAVEDFGTDPDETDLNGSGDVMFVADLAGDSTSDLAVYVNETLLAQEGSASPVEGRDWLSFSSASVALNNVGQHAYRGALDGDALTNLVLIRDGELLAQEGDTAPDGFPIMGFGSSPRLNDAGEVVWTAVSDNDSLFDTTLLVDDEVVAQEGVTMVGGSMITGIATGEDAFFTSDNGNFIVFEATLDDETDVALLVTLCGADFDRDGELSILDFIALQNAFGDANPRADVNADGDLSILDFIAFQNLFTAGCE